MRYVKFFTLAFVIGLPALVLAQMIGAAYFGDEGQQWGVVIVYIGLTVAYVRVFGWRPWWMKKKPMHRIEPTS